METPSRLRVGKHTIPHVKRDCFCLVQWFQTWPPVVATPYNTSDLQTFHFRKISSFPSISFCGIIPFGRRNMESERCLQTGAVVGTRLRERCWIGTSSTTRWAGSIISWWRNGTWPGCMITETCSRACSLASYPVAVTSDEEVEGDMDLMINAFQQSQLRNIWMPCSRWRLGGVVPTRGHCCRSCGYVVSIYLFIIAHIMCINILLVQSRCSNW